MSPVVRRPLARNVGQFVGHLLKALRTTPDQTRSQTHEVRRRTKETDRGAVVLRRTTIDEVEIKDASDGGATNR